MFEYSPEESVGAGVEVCPTILAGSDVAVGQIYKHKRIITSQLLTE